MQAPKSVKAGRGAQPPTIMLKNDNNLKTATSLSPRPKKGLYSAWTLRFHDEEMRLLWDADAKRCGDRLRRWRRYTLAVLATTALLLSDAWLTAR